MTLHSPDIARRALTDAEMTRITTAIAAAGSTAKTVAATITGTLAALLAPLGETLDNYSPERPLDPSRFAIPTAQWNAICEACLARADAFGGRVQAGIVLIDMMPGSYDDPSVTVTTAPLPDQRPYAVHPHRHPRGYRRHHGSLHAVRRAGALLRHRIP